MFMFLLNKKRFGRKELVWFLALALLMSFLVSVVSIWSVWNPFTRSLEFHDDEFLGIFPGSKFSYPLYLGVYHTPHSSLSMIGGSISGRVVVSIFLADVKVAEVGGAFEYAPIYGSAPVHYSFSFPVFSDNVGFFVFLLVVFVLLNSVEALVVIPLAYLHVRKNWHVER
jgi:hypothetical protein